MPVDTPSELFQPEVIALADRHKRALVALWRHYSSRSRALEGEAPPSAPASAPALYGCAQGCDVKRFVTLFAEYDAAPTFLSKRELKHIFGASVAGEGESEGAGARALHAAADAAVEDPAARLSYPAFVEALGRAALRALGRPAFETLYPGPADKLACVLEMWGLADARKLGEVQRRGGGGAASVATSYRR